MIRAGNPPQNLLFARHITSYKCCISSLRSVDLGLGMSDQRIGNCSPISGGNNYAEIREGVRVVCAEFGDNYFRRVTHERRRTQVQTNAALPGGSYLHEPDPVVYWGTRPRPSPVLLGYLSTELLLIRNHSRRFARKNNVMSIETKTSKTNPLN